MAGQDSGTVVANGIICDHVAKLPADKFIKVDFVVPSLDFNLNVSVDLGVFIQELKSFDTTRVGSAALFSPLIFTKNDATFDINWLSHQIQNEDALAEQ